MVVGQFSAGACQFGHGVGGFKINFIHSGVSVDNKITFFITNMRLDVYAIGHIGDLAPVAALTHLARAPLRPPPPASWSGGEGVTRN